MKPSDRLAAISTIVCDHFGVSVATVRAELREKYAVQARWACLHCALVYTQVPIGDKGQVGTISHYFGIGRGAFTHGISRIKDALSGNEPEDVEFAETLLSLASEIETRGFKVRRKL